MSGIRDDWVAFDANEWIFGLTGLDPFSGRLIHERASELRIYIPGQVAAEVRQNLGDDGMSDLFRALQFAKEFRVSYDTAPAELLDKYAAKGAR